jgi:Fic family protein
MKRGLTGHYVSIPSAAGEKPRAFVPNPLPPDPPLVFDAELQELVEKAMLALGRLDGLRAALPEPALFLYSYVRKEAVLSSQIEGTQSSLSDLLLFEIE